MRITMNNGNELGYELQQLISNTALLSSTASMMRDSIVQMNQRAEAQIVVLNNILDAVRAIEERVRP